MNYPSNGISITNMCYQCQALTELCPDCLELKDSRDIDIAHQIVDDGNLQYKFVWSIMVSLLSQLLSWLTVSTT
jgi:hypothetical protein